MKFATLLTGATLAFANSVVADTEEFDMLTIHSGSKVHYSYVVNEEGKLYVSPYSNTTDIGPSVITDGGKLKFGKKYVILQDNGTFMLGAEDSGTTSFGIQAGHVVLDCQDIFSAEPVDNKYFLTINGTSDAIGIALRATLNNGTTLSDFHVANCSNITTLSPGAPSGAPTSVEL